MHQIRFRLGLRPQIPLVELIALPRLTDGCFSFPILSKAAELYLGMNAASVPVECMFSTTGLISNEKRSSIGTQKLNRVLFIHDNFKLVGLLNENGIVQ
jgi:hypothetical protein